MGHGWPRSGRRQSGRKSLRGNTVTGHDPVRVGQASNQAIDVEPGWRRPPSSGRTCRKKGPRGASGISSHDQTKTTNAHPASQVPDRPPPDSQRHEEGVRPGAPEYVGSDGAVERERLRILSWGAGRRAKSHSAERCLEIMRAQPARRRPGRDRPAARERVGEFERKRSRRDRHPSPLPVRGRGRRLRRPPGDARGSSRAGEEAAWPPSRGMKGVTPCRLAPAEAACTATFLSAPPRCAGCGSLRAACDGPRRHEPTPFPVRVPLANPPPDPRSPCANHWHSPQPSANLGLVEPTGLNS